MTRIKDMVKGVTITAEDIAALSPESLEALREILAELQTEDIPVVKIHDPDRLSAEGMQPVGTTEPPSFKKKG